MMSETNILPQQQQDSERYKNAVIMLTVFTTVFAAILVALQVDANIRADVANRNSQYFAILASGEMHRTGLQSNYDLGIFSDHLKNMQEATILQLTALDQEGKGNKKAAQTTRELAAVSQAHADVGRIFSIFYNDPRYTPQTEGGLPNAEQYTADLYKEAKDLVAKQNDEADAYHKWNAKGDAYVNALTILAVAFFLFGLAQVVKNVRMRLTFAIFGVVVVSISLLVAGATLIG